MICEWAEAKGGFAKRVEFTARAKFYSRMLSCFGVQTAACWNILLAHIPNMPLLTFMNEDRLETALMTYNDPERRDPLDTRFGAYCYQMFVQNVWIDAANVYTRIGIPVTLEFIANKLIPDRCDAETKKNLWVYKPVNKVDSTDLSKNVICVNECGTTDLQRLDAGIEKYVAVINYVAQPRNRKQMQEILKNLTAKEGARFLEMKESTEESAWDDLKKDLGANHPVIRLDNLLQQVNHLDTELRCVFFAIPKMDKSDKKKRAKALTEFLGTTYQEEEEEKPEEEEEEEKDVDGDVDMTTTTTTTTQKSSSCESLDADSDDDDEEDDTQAILAAVIAAEQREDKSKLTRTRRTAPVAVAIKKKSSSSRKKKTSRRSK